MKRRARIIALTCVLAFLTGCTEEVVDEETQPTAPTSEKAPDVFNVLFETTKGDVIIEVDRKWAFKGADRFFNLVKTGFLNDTTFFRVVKGFVVQFGLSGKPEVNAQWKDKTLFDDKPSGHSNLRGTVTFALSGPDTRTTQIFFNLGDNSRLDSMGGFTPFDKVMKGMDVVDALYGGYGDMPSQGGKGPDSSKIESQGDAYLKKSFSKLDRITRASVIED